MTEQRKEVMQSDTWDKARELIRKKIVAEYLKLGYGKAKEGYKIKVTDGIYKIMEKEKVTTFYDAVGNTLFDITNEKLQKEHDLMIEQKSWKQKISECEVMKRIKNTTLPCSGGIGEMCDVCERMTHEQPATENLLAENAESKDTKEVISKKETITETEVIEFSAEVKTEDSTADAVAKLEKEKNKDDNFATPIIEYLIGRVNEDTGLVADVLQEHKTWKKCVDYIYLKAKKQANGSSQCAVRNDIVFEWAEDYFHLDDKEIERKKALEAAERKKKQDEAAKMAKEKSTISKKKTVSAKPMKNQSSAVPVNKPEKKSIKPKDQLEGQFSIFDLM